uniref:Uncharacterized protein n=1 Tax=Physcomitrium patens TaxID=3218 RepID=A0A7I4F3R2_PHYPA
MVNAAFVVWWRARSAMLEACRNFEGFGCLIAGPVATMGLQCNAFNLINEALNLGLEA